MRGDTSVPVIVKRRRWAGVGSESGQDRNGDGAEAGPRAPRVFVVGSPASRLAGADEACASQADGAAEATGAGDAAPLRRRRRRREPTRAPGEVRRIVFKNDTELALPPAADPEADGALSLGSASHDYEKVLAGLDKVRATLRSAREARRFTFL